MSLRRRDKDYIGPTRGWTAFFHRLAMFILFPLRKPLIFFPLLLVLFLAPTFNGVKPAEVHSWYWNKVKKYTLAAADFVTDKSKAVLPKDFKLKLPAIGKTVSGSKGTDKLVDYPTVDVNANRRAMFERASGATVQPTEIDNGEFFADETTFGATDENGFADETKVEIPVMEDIVMEEIKPVNKDLPLIYLDTPKEIIGKVKVQNANELDIDGTAVFLYGIYVNPDTPEGIYAKKFLENMVKDQVVRCSIVAYTFQDVATGMCYLNGENINRMMVINKFSKNVAL